MSIVGNIFMGREITNRWGFLDHAKRRDTASRVLKTTIHISGIEAPDKEVGGSPAVRSRPSRSLALSISRAAFCCSIRADQRSFRP